MPCEVCPTRCALPAPRRRLTATSPPREPLHPAPVSDYKASTLKSASALAGPDAGAALDALAFGMVVKGKTVATFTPAAQKAYLAQLKAAVPGARLA